MVAPHVVEAVHREIDALGSTVATAEMAKAGELIQLNAPKSLTALGDDPLRAALSFLSVAECRRSVGATAKHFRALAASTALARTRFSDRYVLRGDTHGVVHFLATVGCSGSRLFPC